LRTVTKGDFWFPRLFSLVFFCSITTISTFNQFKENQLMSKDSTSSAVYNILAFAFDGQKTAGETVKEIKSSGALDGYTIDAQAVVEQDTKGKVHIHEPGRGGVGGTVGAVTGGLLGLIGGPVGVLAWVVGGAVVGGVAGHYMGRPISKGDLKEIGEAMSPDSSAMLLLLEDTYSEGVVNSMSGYKANVVTLTVGDELSGQIAQYTEGAATDAAGDVVAGDSAVVADAAGDVAAASDVVAGTDDSGSDDSNTSS
jgi:uncharacterized membrane protein